ncbi:MAG: hypothetical protein JW928_06845, partial [Candidatus Aureabacteria bacterium]|nr:hypothetical protein [Candidatus Auribacterota bacterium]
HYQQNRYKEASDSLEYSAQLIRQKRAEFLQPLLPEPLDGWTGEEPKSEAIAASMFGGGVTAERRYTSEESSILVKFVADSPIVQSFLMLFTNPTFAAASGGKLERINNQKAIVEYDEAQKEGKVTVIVGNNIVVTVEGSAVKKDDIVELTKKIDFEKLSSFQ